MVRFCAYLVSDLSDISKSRKQEEAAFGFYNRLLFTLTIQSILLA